MKQLLPTAKNFDANINFTTANAQTDRRTLSLFMQYTENN